MVRKEQIKLSVDALYLENIKKDKSFLWNKTKLINNLNFILKNKKYSSTKIANHKLKKNYKRLLFEKLHSVEENSKLYLDSKMGGKNMILTLIFRLLKSVKTEKITCKAIFPAYSRDYVERMNDYGQTTGAK